MGAGGDLNIFRWFVPGVGVQSNDFHNMHTEIDNPDSVSWTGLEAVTRAFAKIIDEVNKLSLADLQRPEENPTDTRQSLIPAHCTAWIKDPSADCTP